MYIHPRPSDTTIRSNEAPVRVPKATDEMRRKQSRRSRLTFLIGQEELTQSHTTHDHTAPPVHACM
jgi:hypothetical protein